MTGRSRQQLPPGKAKRGLWQFGLRAPLLLIAALAVPLGIWKVYLSPYLKQHRDLIALRKAGAEIQTELTMSATWIMRLDPLGSERYHEGIEVDLGRTDFEPETIEHLLSLRKLKTLKIRGAKFRLEHLRRLRSQRSLRLIRLDSTSVSHEEYLEARQWFPKAEVQLSQSWDVERMSDAGGWFQRIGFPVLRPRKSTVFAFESGRGAPPDFDQVRSVVLPFRNAFLGRLPYLYFVEDLRLRQGGWDFKELPRMPRLSQLSLAGVPFRSTDLKHVARIKDLASLDLTATSVDDNALAQLRHLPALRRLRLGRTSVTDEGLRHLAEHTKLVELNLSNTSVTSDGLRHLSKLTHLEQLDLRRTKIDDQALAHLRHLTRLERLHLNATRISDRGARQLGSLESLRWLDLSRTQVTKNGADELDAQLPHNPIVR